MLLLEIVGLVRTTCDEPINFYAILTFKLAAFGLGFLLTIIHALVRKSRRRLKQRESPSIWHALRHLHALDVLHNAFLYLLFCYSGVSLTLFRALECETIGDESVLLVRCVPCVAARARCTHWSRDRVCDLCVPLCCMR